ncbi:MAG: hypothetical protein MUE47_10190, partial [Acidobacteria bacterium]|nr:hypothetical protein [Acidobacteriota bacterium]
MSDSIDPVMKLPAVLLTVSVLANAVLVAVLVSTRQAEDSSGAAPGSSAADPAVRVVDAGAQSPTFAAQGGETGPAATPDTDGSARLVALAVGGDLSALVRALRSGGIPEEAVRGIIRELLGLRQRDRLVQLLAGGDADQPYWQLDPRNRPTPEVRAEIRRLQRELQEELDRMLGPAPVTLGRASRYGFLDEGKRTLLEQIDSDYNEMIREVREGMAGF